jgi:hypothetical protein
MSDIMEIHKSCMKNITGTKRKRSLDCVEEALMLVNKKKRKIEASIKEKRDAFEKTLHNEKTLTENYGMDIQRLEKEISFLKRQQEEFFFLLKSTNKYTETHNEHSLIGKINQDCTYMGGYKRRYTHQEIDHHEWENLYEAELKSEDEKVDKYAKTAIEKTDKLFDCLSHNIKDLEEIVELSLRNEHNDIEERNCKLSFDADHHNPGVMYVNALIKIPVFLYIRKDIILY